MKMPIFYGLMLILLLGTILVKATYDRAQINNAIEQCEAELPRHQHCDYRIEAFVVEGE